MSNRRFHEQSWSIVPFSRDLPEKTQSSVSRKTAPLTRHVGKRNRTRAPTLERTHRVSSKRLPKHDIKGLILYQILGKLTSQRKRDMKFNGKKDQRRQVSSDISKSHTHFQWEEPMYVRALQCHSGENVYMSTFSPKEIEKG